MSENERPEFFSEKAAAKRLGVSVKTLQKWRFYGEGPDYYKFGNGSIRYTNDTLDKFKNQSLVIPAIKRAQPCRIK